MCRFKHFTGKECQHQWIVISSPCAPGKTFATCPQMKSEATFVVDRDYFRRETETMPSKTCPMCFPDVVPRPYKEKFVRYVTGARSGTRIGAGPARRSPGIEWFCAVM